MLSGFNQFMSCSSIFLYFTADCIYKAENQRKSAQRLHSRLSCSQQSWECCCQIKYQWLQHESRRKCWEISILSSLISFKGKESDNTNTLSHAGTLIVNKTLFMVILCAPLISSINVMCSVKGIFCSQWWEASWFIIFSIDIGRSLWSVLADVFLIEPKQVSLASELCRDWLDI